MEINPFFRNPQGSEVFGSNGIIDNCQDYETQLNKFFWRERE
jgi:hypothetical protein